MDKIVLFSAASFGTSFLLGSIPWGLIISKIFYSRDIREYGSGNIGTTNAFRTMGAVGGSVVFVLDFLKGILSGWLSMAFAVMAVADLSAVATLAIVVGPHPVDVLGFPIVDSESLTAVNTHVFSLIACLGLAGSICGHVFSPWLRFKGGKGIAVAAGCIFAVFGIPAFLVLAGTFALMTIVTRYVSVGSISAAAVAPLVAYWAMHREPFAVGLTTIVASLVVWAHRSNIARLRAGNENRIGAKKKEE